MQFRIRDNDSSATAGSRSQFLKVSTALFVASSILLTLPMTSEAFVPTSLSQHKAPSTRLFYTMPDVTNMKAKDMRQELESYGIKTHTLFDKCQFEKALIEARHNYEQTLNDVMASTRPKEKKVQPKRKTVNYDRGRHQDERIYSSDVNDQQQHHYAEEHQQQRRRTHYQAEPNPVGNFNTYPNNNGPQTVGVGGSRRRPGNEWFEEDPLFAHEKQAQHFRPDDYHHHYHHDQYEHEQHYEEYEVGARQRHPQARPTYSDAAMETKYQTALQESYTMKVVDLQHELNCRGVSTKYCMIFKDFCIEYAKAIAENRKKVTDEPRSDSDREDNDDASSAFGDDDDDYDPNYTDVVMQKYDPSMWI